MSSEMLCFDCAYRKVQVATQRRDAEELRSRVNAMEMEIQAKDAHLCAIKDVVDEQANNPELWSHMPLSKAWNMESEFKRLHDVIEGI